MRSNTARNASSNEDSAALMSRAWQRENRLRRPLALVAVRRSAPGIARTTSTTSTAITASPALIGSRSELNRLRRPPELRLKWEFDPRIAQ